MLLTFFSKQNEQNQLVSQYSDDTRSACLFEALAHSVVNLLSNEKENKSHFKFLLSQHALYYPRQLPKHLEKLSIDEQCDYLLIYTQPHKKILIPSMAYTLHQISIDVMCQYPEIYGNLLLEGHTIQNLRKNSKLDDSGLLQALAKHALHSNIYIERYNSPYELPVKEYYTASSNEQFTPIKIQVKESQYRSQHAIAGENNECR